PLHDALPISEHADIPLQRTPSLEYHPLRFHAITNQAGRRRGIPDTREWVFFCCNTLLPLVKAIRRMAEKSVKIPLASPFARPRTSDFSMHASSQIRLTFNQDHPAEHEDDSSGIAVQESK